LILGVKLIIRDLVEIGSNVLVVLLIEENVGVSNLIPVETGDERTFREDYLLDIID